MKEICKKTGVIIIFFSLIIYVQGQTITTLTAGQNTSLRGLSVVNNRVIWVSGSNGKIGKSIDGGINWQWITVEGFEKTDFRDIEAFDEMTALIIGVAEPGYILKTVDGGKSWKVVFESRVKGIFLDAMEFWNEISGIVIGDPIDNKFFIGRTFDGGSSWQEIPNSYKPMADSGEACFAASGTNICKRNKQEAIFVSGGLQSHIFIKGKKYKLPFAEGKESCGANSVAVKNNSTIIVVGGDFNNKDITDANCFITSDGGKSWRPPGIPPHGYRSCVEYLYKNRWVCTGLNGSDYSTDNGKTWKEIDAESYHVCKKAKKGKSVFFAGSNGKIGKLVAEKK